MERMLFVYLLFDLTASVISIIFGCCFLFVAIPRTEALANYRFTRKLMAFAYFVLGFGNLFAILSQSAGISINLTEVYSVTVSIASLQAFAFTYTLITLVNPRFTTRRKLLYQLLLIGVFLLLVAAASLTGRAAMHRIVNGLFFLFYVFQLCYYTAIFLREEMQARKQLEAFYSGEEVRKLNWVRTSFFASLAVGVNVGLCLSFLNYTLLLVMIAIYSVFYICFAIKYINYPQTFHALRDSLGEELEPTEATVLTSYSELADKIDRWVMHKGFTSCGVTVNDLASALNSNRTYVSIYINTHMKVNFNTWINQLRIEEARLLMQQHPDWPISRISVEIGYADSSCFGKQFRKITGVSPTMARVNNQ